MTASRRNLTDREDVVDVVLDAVLSRQPIPERLDTPELREALGGSPGSNIGVAAGLWRRALDDRLQARKEATA